MRHWHVESGLSGYGPDAADTDGFTPYEDIRQAADAAMRELLEWAEQEGHAADALAGSGDYEGAWRTLKHSDELINRAQNLSAEREQAPLYRDDPAAWEATLAKLLEDFPLGVDPSYGIAPSDYFRSSIYVWQCDETECTEQDDE